MLILSLISVTVVIGGVLLLKKLGRKLGFWLETCLEIAVGVSVVVALLIPILWGLEYNTNKANIAVYYSVKESVEKARSENVSEIERGALTTKIIEMNETLASKKYWNETMFGDLIPDELANLPYLE